MSTFFFVIITLTVSLGSALGTGFAVELGAEPITVWLIGAFTGYVLAALA